MSSLDANALCRGRRVLYNQNIMHTGPTADSQPYSLRTSRGRKGGYTGSHLVGQQRHDAQLPGRLRAGNPLEMAHTVARRHVPADKRANKIQDYT